MAAATQQNMEVAVFMDTAHDGGDDAVEELHALYEKLKAQDTQ